MVLEKELRSKVTEEMPECFDLFLLHPYEYEELICVDEIPSFNIKTVRMTAMNIV